MNKPESTLIVVNGRVTDDCIYTRGTQLPPRSPALPCVRSADLFGVDREIMIEHSGAYYRLRLTRANKLILTK
jgi:hemin uptake protein HemP